MYCQECTSLIMQTYLQKFEDFQLRVLVKLTCSIDIRHSESSTVLVNCDYFLACMKSMIARAIENNLIRHRQTLEDGAAVGER